MSKLTALLLLAVTCAACVDEGSGEATSSSGTVSVPWWLLGTIVPLVAVISLAGRRRR